MFLQNVYKVLILGFERGEREGRISVMCMGVICTKLKIVDLKIVKSMCAQQFSGLAMWRGHHMLDLCHLEA